jgi:putative glutamine amidotransferase
MSPPSQPLIGITSGLTRNKAGSPVCQVGQAYVTAVQRAGGIPVMIPIGIDQDRLDALLPRLDGLLFTGGGDIDPQRFNDQPHKEVYDISPERDQLEFALVEKATVANLPLLAVCRGIQVLNVAFGGTLHTHIQDQLPGAMKHDWSSDHPRDTLTHPVSLTCGCILHNIFVADNIQVNSLHHQGIARVGDGLRATAFAPDGLVEGVEVEGTEFVIGVQWHPECLPNDPGMQSLFRAFIEACQQGLLGTHND